MFEIDQKLKNLIKDKRIIIVGPSPHLLNKNFGNKIDKYDFVCRINSDIYPKGYEKDYGSRTDIISWSGDTKYLCNFEKNLEIHKKKLKKLKYIFLSSTLADHFGGSVLDNFQKVNTKYNYEYGYIGDENYKIARNFFQCEPNSGQMTLWFLLQHEPKEIFLTGFSFYEQFRIKKDPYSLFYDHDLIYPILKVEEWFDPFGAHNQDIQKKKFLELFYENKKILFLDDYLKEILNIS